jgi:hypothetical protein
MCPICHENELRPRQKFCSGACKTDAWRLREKKKKKATA